MSKRAGSSNIVAKFVLWNCNAFAERLCWWMCFL